MVKRLKLNTKKKILEYSAPANSMSSRRWRKNWVTLQNYFFLNVVYLWFLKDESIQPFSPEKCVISGHSNVHQNPHSIAQRHHPCFLRADSHRYCFKPTKCCYSAQRCLLSISCLGHWGVKKTQENGWEAWVQMNCGLS